MAANDAVWIAVGELRRGDHVYLPGGSEREVVRIEGPYDDGTVVVVYSTGRSSSIRFGEERFTTADVQQGLVPMLPTAHVLARRG